MGSSVIAKLHLSEGERGPHCNAFYGGVAPSCDETEDVHSRRTRLLFFKHGIGFITSLNRNPNYIFLFKEEMDVLVTGGKMAVSLLFCMDEPISTNSSCQVQNDQLI